MDIFIKTFEELTLNELHDIFQLRSEVFVVEQDCVYQDVDGKDKKALHVFGKKSGRIAAYTRCFGPGDYFAEASIGRVVVPMDYRKDGYGHDIMKASLKAIKDTYGHGVIKLSAQIYLVKFYESHGFATTGESYLEDGIPHIGMVKV
ncbi:MAG: GNAT family N-acetyltransferase [Bacteroidetes bacterium]|nr:GNAT family N-acetyltransferase [Bacteroidota bacterium]